MGIFTGDTHYHNHESETEVTEHRAPTDDSIALLNEMQDKARENVLCFGKAKLEGMTGEFEYYIIRLPEKMFSLEIGIRVVFNGKELIDKKEIPSYEEPKTIGERVKVFYDMVSVMITKELLFNNRFLEKIHESWK